MLCARRRQLMTKIKLLQLPGAEKNLNKRNIDSQRWVFQSKEYGLSTQGI